MVPKKAKKTLQYIDQLNGAAPPKVKGKKKYDNVPKNHRDQILPKVDENGDRITYTEYDIEPPNPKKRKNKRGTGRLVLGTDESAYYTANHYHTFTRTR